MAREIVTNFAGLRDSADISGGDAEQLLVRGAAASLLADERAAPVVSVPS